MSGTSRVVMQTLENRDFERNKKFHVSFTNPDTKQGPKWKCFHVGDARSLTSKIQPLCSMVNFDADVKETTVRHQCENHLIRHRSDVDFGFGTTGCGSKPEQRGTTVGVGQKFMLSFWVNS